MDGVCEKAQRLKVDVRVDRQKRILSLEESQFYPNIVRELVVTDRVPTNNHERPYAPYKIWVRSVVSVGVRRYPTNVTPVTLTPGRKI